MNNTVNGLHHITAIAGDPQQNYDFYTKVLGLRLVKKTVNFDDPQTYHFYFGTEEGTPGTILTFFPWPRVKRGQNGPGMASEIAFSVPEGSLTFWMDRFDKMHVSHGKPSLRFGEEMLYFRDPDGLNLSLTVAKTNDNRKPWQVEGIPATAAIKGFHSVNILLKDKTATAAILTEILNYEFVGQEGNIYRYKSKSVDNAAIVDIFEFPSAQPGIGAGGTIHHVAFRVHNEDTLMSIRKTVVERGLHITEKIDRQYFYSLYFREPGGVLFEIATDNPGFNTDEIIEDLGSSLKLPPQYEPAREAIEKGLPKLLS